MLILISMLSVFYFLFTILFSSILIHLSNLPISSSSSISGHIDTFWLQFSISKLFFLNFEKILKLLSFLASLF